MCESSSQFGRFGNNIDPSTLDESKVFALKIGNGNIARGYDKSTMTRSSRPVKLEVFASEDLTHLTLPLISGYGTKASLGRLHNPNTTWHLNKPACTALTILESMRNVLR